MDIYFSQVISKTYVCLSRYSLSIEFLSYLHFCLTFHLTVLSLYVQDVSVPCFRPTNRNSIYGLIHSSLDSVKASLSRGGLFKNRFFQEFIYIDSFHSTYKSDFTIRSSNTYVYISMYFYAKLHKIVLKHSVIKKIYYKDSYRNLHTYLFLYIKIANLQLFLMNNERIITS